MADAASPAGEGTSLLACFCICKPSPALQAFRYQNDCTEAPALLDYLISSAATRRIHRFDRWTRGFIALRPCIALAFALALAPSSDQTLSHPPRRVNDAFCLTFLPPKPPIPDHYGHLPTVLDFSLRPDRRTLFQPSCQLAFCQSPQQHTHTIVYSLSLKKVQHTFPSSLSLLCWRPLPSPLPKSVTARFFHDPPTPLFSTPTPPKLYVISQ